MWLIVITGGWSTIDYNFMSIPQQHMNNRTFAYHREGFKVLRDRDRADPIMQVGGALEVAVPPMAYTTAWAALLYTISGKPMATQVGVGKTYRSPQRGYDGAHRATC